MWIYTEGFSMLFSSLCKKKHVGSLLCCVVKDGQNYTLSQLRFLFEISSKSVQPFRYSWLINGNFLIYINKNWRCMKDFHLRTAWQIWLVFFGIIGWKAQWAIGVLDSAIGSPRLYSPSSPCNHCLIILLQDWFKHKENHKKYI